MIQSKEDLRFYIREDKKRNLGAYKIGVFMFAAHWLYGTDQMKAYRLLRALRRTEYAKNVLRKRGLFGKIVYVLRQWQYHRLEKRYNIAIGTNMVGYGFRLPHVVGGGHNYQLQIYRQLLWSERGCCCWQQPHMG